MNESFAFQGYSFNNQIVCVINGEDICQMNYMTGQQTPIGKTMAAYNDLEQTTKEYYDKLVELGVIEVPKDPQTAMEEMRQTIHTMADMIQSLSKEVKELRQNDIGANAGDGGEDVSVLYFVLHLS